MSYISKSKGLLGFLMAFILLSFFYASPLLAGAQAGAGVREDVRTYQHCATSKEAVLTSPDAGVAESAARISLARTMMDEVVMREQHAARTLLFRFLAVVSIAILLIHVICQQLCRRYGYHMIFHWQNINYIHKVDGKKEERFSVYIE